MHEATRDSGAIWLGDLAWFKEGEPMEDWHGVSIYDRRVVSLNLNNSGLVGQIPPELSQLSSLMDLLLDGNQLSGEIPPELSQLSSLSGLDLSDNQFIGEIPPELGQLTELRLLDLSNNQFIGEIPTELNELTQLTRLDLSGNAGLTGCVPNSLELSLNPKSSNLGGLSYCYLVGQ